MFRKISFLIAISAMTYGMYSCNEDKPKSDVHNQEIENTTKIETGESDNTIDTSLIVDETQDESMDGLGPNMNTSFF